jgi:hypothetical protein
MRPWTRWRRATCALAGAVLLLGCTEPLLSDPTAGEAAGPDEDPVSSDLDDPARDALLATVAGLHDTITAAQARLEEAADAATTPAARAAADDALALLLAEDDADPARLRPLFPAQTADRDDAGERGDALTVTLNAARATNSDLGRRVLEFLRDPVAGDIGAWERDAEGVVAAARLAVTGGSDVDGLVPTVLELPGDGTRALAWTLLATSASDGEVVRAAADRAAAHLGVVLVGLTLLDPPPVEDRATTEADEAADPAARGNDP